MNRREIRSIMLRGFLMAPFRAYQYLDLGHVLVELALHVLEIVRQLAWIVARFAALLTWPLSGFIGYRVARQLRVHQIKTIRRRRADTRAAMEAHYGKLRRKAVKETA